MKATFILYVAAVLIGLPGIAWGHYPEGMTFLAFQWPSGQEPVMDGDLSEWKVVSDEYVLNTMEFTTRGIFEDIVSPDDALEGLRLQEYWFPQVGIGIVWTSWSSSENALYIAARVFDDEHSVHSKHYLPDQPRRIWEADGFCVSVDADHSGGVYSDSDWLEDDLSNEIKREYWDLCDGQATDYITAWPVANDVPFVAFTTPATWLQDPPWFEGGWDYRDHMPPEALTGYERRMVEEYAQLRPYRELPALLPTWNVTTYELKIVPFDRIDWRGPEGSVVHTLQEGEIIGMNYSLTDARDGISSGRVLSSIEVVSDGRHSASRFSDFLLASIDRKVFEGTPVQSSTWGRIKTSFNHR